MNVWVNAHVHTYVNMYCTAQVSFCTHRYSYNLNYPSHGALSCFIQLFSCRLCNLQNCCILNTRKWTTILELASTEHLRCWGFAFIAINTTTYQFLSNKTDSRTASSAIGADCKKKQLPSPNLAQEVVKQINWSQYIPGDSQHVRKIEVKLGTLPKYRVCKNAAKPITTSISKCLRWQCIWLLRKHLVGNKNNNSTTPPEN